MAVRWGPVVTVMNGTLVARPVRAILVQLGGAGSTVTAVRPVLGDHRLVGKSLEGSRPPGRETRTLQRRASLAFQSIH